MTVKFKLDSRAVPDGTVLLFGIRYVGPDQEGIGREPAEEAKVYTYAMIKAGGFWYVTGGGRTPQAAGWGAIERWLERDGRVVEWVRHVTETVQLWPVTHAFEASHSGMVCGAMVQAPDGTGDQCGKLATDVVHAPSQPADNLADQEAAQPAERRRGTEWREKAQTTKRRRGTEWREKVRTPEDEALGYRQVAGRDDQDG